MATGGTEEMPALTLLWNIENISFYDCGLHGNEIRSPFFTTGMSRRKWRIGLFPKGGKEENQHFLINLDPFPILRYPIDCELSIIGIDGSSLVTETFRNLFTKNLIILGCPHEEVFVSRKSAFLPNDTLTVQCRIWKSDVNLKCSEYYFRRSRIEVQKDSFQWFIKKFSGLQLEQEVTIDLDVYVAGRVDEFTLNFSLTGSSLEKAVAQIELVSSVNELFITLKVSVCDNKGKAMISAEENLIFDGLRQESLIFPNFATRKELLAKQSDCLSSDVLTLHFEVTAVSESILHFIEKTSGAIDLTLDVAKYPICSNSSGQTSQQRSDEQSIDSLVTLGEDWLSLYRDHTGSDFELRSGDVSFPVHKQVLMARSPVFRAMFCSDMRESGTHSLDVPDVDPHALNRMLTFLYAGTVDPELHWESATRLYYAADKYQVQSLKQRCSSILQSTISVLNVSDILTLADRHQDKELTSFVQDFILRRFNDIMITDEWYAFLEQNPSLAGTTMKHGFRRKLEMTKSQ